MPTVSTASTKLITSVASMASTPSRQFYPPPLAFDGVQDESLQAESSRARVERLQCVALECTETHIPQSQFETCGTTKGWRHHITYLHPKHEQYVKTLGKINKSIGYNTPRMDGAQTVERLPARSGRGRVGSKRKKEAR
jgi:hypothetical protein